MTNRDDQRKGGPPSDDRTLLDPLSSDELAALRQARQRIQQQKQARTSLPAVEVSPRDSDAEPTDTASTHAMPSLPGFEERVSLDQIKARSGSAAADSSATIAEGPSVAPSEPMSVYRTRSPDTGSLDTKTPDTRAPDADATVAAVLPRTPPEKTAPPSSSAPSAGRQPGFGENTLMWMQPPKGAPQPRTHTMSDVLPPQSKKETFIAQARTFGVAMILMLLVIALAAAILSGGTSGVVELHTDPAGALVKIDGAEQVERTPVKLTMLEGVHTIQLQLDGYEPTTLSVEVNSSQPGVQQISLKPQSAEGRMTLTVNVQPVSASITLDGDRYTNKRTVRIANVDPTRPHRLIVEAPGYKKIDKQVASGELKPSYTFALQTDPNTSP